METQSQNGYRNEPQVTGAWSSGPSHIANKLHGEYTMVAVRDAEHERALWERVWHRAKIWRTVRVGPIAAHFRLSRAKALTKANLRSIRVGVAKRDMPAHPLHPQKAHDAPAGTAAVFGMGPGFGEGLARSLVAHNMRVALVSRTASRWDDLIGELRSQKGCVNGYAANATDEISGRRCVAAIERDLGHLDLAVYGIQSSNPGGVLDTTVAAFEDAWRANCLGAFIMAREIGVRMAARGAGTIVFAGATSGTVGRAGYLNLAVGKFGLRALAQVMARELGHRGIHVVHLLIDANIEEGKPDDEGPSTDAVELGDLICMLHKQPRSTWTHELDVRPWNERFWEHC